MNELQVLVATMHQTDFSIGEKMNIRCDAVFANQCGTSSVQTVTSDQGVWKMISTDTRGVGINRNIALLAADADIILFADDDIEYYDGTLEGVKKAFREFPKADVIIFSVDLEKNGVVYEKRRVPHKKMHVWNSMKYGTYSIAARKSAIVRKNITFHHCFGGGGIYGSGEDSLFLKECFDKKLKVYSYDYVLGKCNKDNSTWFTGYHEKYYYDKGAVLALLFPYLKYLMVPVFAYRLNKSKLSLIQRMGCMYQGMRNVQKLIPYSDEG